MTSFSTAADPPTPSPRLLAGKRLPVITRSIPVARLFAETGAVATTDTSGSIDRRLGILRGPLCDQAFPPTHAEVAILGGTGPTAQGIWNSPPCSPTASAG